MAERVRVFARLRPAGSGRAESAVEAVRCEGERGVVVDDLEAAVTASLGSSLGSAAEKHRKAFEFDGCFGGASTQAEVFAEVGAPVVASVLAGYHGCVFAYGQTGSGKTHSLLHGGTAAAGFADSGLLPRLAANLFVRAAMDAGNAYSVECGCFQARTNASAARPSPEQIPARRSTTSRSTTCCTRSTRAAAGRTWARARTRRVSGARRG